MKKILIAGANSYIGCSFEAYAKEHYSGEFEIYTIDMIDGSWRDKNFSMYDIVFHVAGLAHADVGNVSEEIKKKYYAINTDLAIETAKKSKAEGVGQFVFMSSMIVYGDMGCITMDTKPCPGNFYGDSKWQAEKGIRELQSESFCVTILRPPVVYGSGSKGNYPMLAKFARKLPIFPKVNTKRSFLYIGKLCEFLCQIMKSAQAGVFFPQNKEIVSICEMVKTIAAENERRIVITPILMPLAMLGMKLPGKIGGLCTKAFGNRYYEPGMSDCGINYQVYGFEESIKLTERGLNE